MLKSTDGICPVPPSRHGLVVALAALFVVSGSALTVRGMARADDQKSGKSVTAKPVSKSRVVDATSATEQVGFNRPPINMEDLVDNRFGMFLFRAQPLFKHPLFGPLAKGYVQQTLPMAKRALEIDTQSLDVSKVDWVTGRMIVTLGKNPNEKIKQNNSLSLGSSGAIIRLTQDVKLDEWISRHVPHAAAEKSGDSGGYVIKVPTPLPTENPTAAPVNPWRVGVRQRDPRTIVVGLNQGGGGEKDGGPFASGQSARAARMNQQTRLWESLGGGVVAFVFTDANFRGLVPPESSTSETQRTLERFVSSVSDRCTCFGFGMDFDGERVLVQIRLLHASYSKATLSLAGFQQIQELPKEQTDADGIPGLVMDRIRSATATVKHHDDSTGELVIRATLTPLELLTAFGQTAK